MRFLLFAAVCFGLLSAVVSARSTSDSTVQFLVAGDWGGQSDAPYTTPGELSAAREMSKWVQREAIDTVLLVGDNFYSNGVTGVDDPRFNTTFEQVFTEAAFPNVSFQLVAGNHDWHSNPEYEVAYSKAHPRWRYPALWYSFSGSFADQQMYEFVMIDTIVLCGNTEENIAPDPVASSAELKWIENALATSPADWLFVAGHYPVFSVAEHGPTDCLINQLRPLMLKYGVAAFFCGHDHGLQSLEETDGQLLYVLSGAAHGCECSTKHEKDVPAGVSKFYWCGEGAGNVSDESGFVHLNLTETELKVKYLSSTGEALYEAKTTNPRAKPGLFEL